MTCEEAEIALISLLDHTPDSTVPAELQQHLATCAECRREAEELREMRRVLEKDKLVMPDQMLRENFNNMLQAEINLATTARIVTPGKPFFSSELSALWKVAAAFIILALGIFVGTRLNIKEDTGFANKSLDPKETLLLALLAQESPSERIRAVGYAEEIENPDKKVIDALVHTMNQDKNVNVRMAAIYSLGKFTADKAVRDSMVVSLGKQTEPILQIVLMNLLTESKDKRAAALIRKIIGNAGTNKEVKEVGTELYNTF